jgi:hypothetical protein
LHTTTAGLDGPSTGVRQQRRAVAEAPFSQRRAATTVSVNGQIKAAQRCAIRETMTACLWQRAIVLQSVHALSSQMYKRNVLVLVTKPHLEVVCSIGHCHTRLCLCALPASTWPSRPSAVAKAVLHGRQLIL